MLPSEFPRLVLGASEVNISRRKKKKDEQGKQGEGGTPISSFIMQSIRRSFIFFYSNALTIPYTKGYTSILIYPLIILKYPEAQAHAKCKRSHPPPRSCVVPCVWKVLAWALCISLNCAFCVC